MMRPARSLGIAALAAALCGNPLLASSPLVWEMRQASGAGATVASVGEEKLAGISIGPQGQIALSTTLRAVFPEGDAPPPPVVWDAAVDSEGTLWVGTGHSGALYRVDTKGKATKEFETNRLGVTALVASPEGGIYAATFPSGAVYEVKAGKDPVPWMELEDRYIWSLASANGWLYAATGIRGILYRTREAGENEVLLDSDQTHVTALTVDKEGRLIAGTDPDGLVLQLSTPGVSRVLLDADLREVSAIVASSDGTLYAAAISDEPLRPPTRSGDKGDLTIEVKEAADGTILEEAREAATIRIDLADLLPAQIRDGEGIASRLYRIDPDRPPRLVWKSDTERIGALVDLGGRGLLIGTGGPEGAQIRRLEQDGTTTLLQRLKEQQLTALKAHRDGRLYAATANPGRVYVMDAAAGSSGEYTSRSLDAGRMAQWGTLTWDSSMPTGTRVEVMTRSGNRPSPDESWSEWSPTAPADRGSAILSPAARFLQWKVALSRLQTEAIPEIRNVKVTMLPHNRPPVMTSLAVLKTGEEIETPRSDGGDAKKESKKPPAGMRWIHWKSADPDADPLLCSILVRRTSENDGEFRQLAETVKETPWAFDDKDLAEGRYTVRVIADDSPANGLERALKGTLEAGFLVDRTPPEVTLKSPQRQGDLQTVEALATDALGRIDHADYGARAGEEEPAWIPLPCNDGICDTSREGFLLPTAARSGGGKLLLRVHDEAGNTTTIEVPSP